MTPEHAIRTYLRAKDDNRPWLMPAAFAADASLVIAAPPGTLALPPATHGLDAITDVLVRRFAQTFENVLTFCLASPPEIDATSFSCAWLVGMSEKDSRAVRVGYGRYDWSFHDASPRLAIRLAIDIEVMQVLPTATLGPIMTWLAGLPYPWCPLQAAISTAPAVEGLASVNRRLRSIPIEHLG